MKNISKEMQSLTECEIQWKAVSTRIYCHPPNPDLNTTGALAGESMPRQWYW